MRTEPRERPAALAVLLYACGLAAAPLTISAGPAVAGLLAVCALLLLVKARLGTRASVLLLFLAMGMFVGGRLSERRAAEATRLSLESPDAFATVRFEIEDDWAARPDGAWRARARSFELLDAAGGGFAFRARIHVLLYDEPPDMGEAGHVVARGFLRPLEGGAYALSVKSASLVHLEGRASKLDPRSWNRWFSRRLEDAAGTSRRAREGSALVQALVLGRGALLPWEVIDLFQRGGTYHLLVFSGVQIAMMAALVRWLLLRLGWRRTADAALLVICAFMPRFVGADPSVSRSALMIGLLLGCQLWQRPTDAANLVFVAALVRLVLVPEDLTDPGFALTYSATAGILVVGKALAKDMGRAGKVVAYGAGAELGTTPFTLLFFNRATIGGSIVTLVVSPVVTLMLGLGFLAVGLAPVAPHLCGRVLELVGWLNGGVLWVNRFVAEDARLSFVAASPSTAVLVAAVVAAIVAGAGGSRRRDLVVAACLLVPLASTVVRSLPDKTIEGAVDFLDVGQGDATLVTSRGRAMLVDGGGSLSDPAFATRTLLPMLAERRTRRLDAVVLSHPHPDHCAGLVAVLRDLDVGRLVLSRRHLATECGTVLVDAAMRRHVPVIDAESIGELGLGEFRVEIFGTAHRYRRAWENNSSLLVRLTAHGRSALLTGDIEREAEEVLLEQKRERLAADVVKVPHHGSRSSSSPRFVAAVEPRIAVISCGVRNRFGHPHAEPLATLRQAGARIEGTARGGTVRIWWAGGRLFTGREFDSGRSDP